LANIAYRLGRSIEFDPKTEKIVNDAEAAKLARRCIATRGSSRKSTWPRETQEARFSEKPGF